MTRFSRPPHPALAVAAVIAIAAVIVTAVILAPRPHRVAGPPPLRVTGIYADDWQDNCGALIGTAQTECASRLDAKYGRAENVPVPAGK